MVKKQLCSMNDLTYNVKIRRIMTGGFEVGNCLKQGDGLAPSHFDVALQYEKKTAVSRTKIHNISQISATT
jgi:hypothetical protein